jgi:hypothetical protein
MQFNSRANGLFLVLIRCNPAPVVAVLQHFHLFSTDKKPADKTKWRRPRQPDLAEHASGKRGGRPIKGDGFQMQRPSHGPSSINAWPHRACPDEGEKRNDWRQSGIPALGPRDSALDLEIVSACSKLGLRSLMQSRMLAHRIP